MSSANDESDGPTANRFPSEYPVGFAQRFLDWAGTAGPARANIDLELREIDFVDEYRESDARLRIDDDGLKPAWTRLIGEARGFYPQISAEEGAMTMLTVSIEEFLRTNYSAKPRYFTIEEILR
jgi:hypothetical protein